MERYIHYQSDFKSSSSDYYDVYYPHPLTIEIEKKSTEKNSKDLSLPTSSFFRIIGKLADRLTNRHEKTLSHRSR